MTDSKPVPGYGSHSDYMSRLQPQVETRGRVSEARLRSDNIVAVAFAAEDERSIEGAAKVLLDAFGFRSVNKSD